MATIKSRIPEILKKNETQLLNEWLKEQQAVANSGGDVIGDEEQRQHSARFLRLLREAVQDGNFTDMSGSGWADLRDHLETVAARRAVLGFTPSQIATFVLSFKQPLFSRIKATLGDDAESFADELWSATKLIDNLALITFESFIRTREDMISRQQADMLELSTPVVKLWDGILALPMIGTLDSARSQVVMESLLQRIVETGSQIAILDITGVPTVDTLVAQHLIKTVAAARLMGADCIISGIRPQIAQTMVHLAIDLTNIVTKATLADAFVVALEKIGASVGGTAQRNTPNAIRRNDPPRH